MSRPWRLMKAWPRRLIDLPVSAAVAIETAALAIRMVCSRLEDPELGLSQNTEQGKNPLLDFALRHDDRMELLPATEQAALLTAICDAFGVPAPDLSFSALWSSELMNQTFWENPQLTMFKVYHRYTEDQPWTLTEAHDIGAASEIHWKGEVAPTTYQSGTRRIPGSKFHFFFSASMPHVLRIRLEPPAESQLDLIASKVLHLEACYLEPTGEDRELVAKIRTIDYTIMGAIRHRRTSDDTELVRFYDDCGLYITPSLPDGKYLARPYVADEWNIGAPGFTYTLLYCDSTPTPYEHDEFIPEESLAWDNELASPFECVDQWLGLPSRNLEELGDVEDSQQTERSQQSQQTENSGPTELDLAKLLGR